MTSAQLRRVLGLLARLPEQQSVGLIMLTNYDAMEACAVTPTLPMPWRERFSSRDGFWSVYGQFPVQRQLADAQSGHPEVPRGSRRK